MTVESTQTLSLRQLAIFVDSLDRQTADQLLEAMSEADHQNLRDAMIELADVSDEERQSVTSLLQEKMVATGEATDQNQPAEISDEVRDVSESVDETRDIDAPLPVLSASGFSKLDDEQRVPRNVLRLSVVLESAPIETLARILCDEHSQILAVVMSALSSSRAAAFLARFAASRQADILRRVAEIEDADPVLLEEMQQELADQLSSEVTEVREVGTNRGLRLAHSIISATPRKERAALMSQLETKDQRLARSLAFDSPPLQSGNGAGTEPKFASVNEQPQPVSVTFDRFVDLDRYSLIEVFTQIPNDVAVLALAGASQPCMADVLERLPGDLSSALRDGLRGLGALRLSDIQSAQEAAVEVSRQVLSQSPEGTSDQPLKLTA